LTLTLRRIHVKKHSTSRALVGAESDHACSRGYGFTAQSADHSGGGEETMDLGNFSVVPASRDIQGTTLAFYESSTSLVPASSNPKSIVRRERADPGCSGGFDKTSTDLTGMDEGQRDHEELLFQDVREIQRTLSVASPR
jgi:hypothetical protein